MNILDAAALTVRDYPGGTAAMAQRLGKSVHSLRHELTGDGTAKLGVLDAEQITHFAQQVHAPNALAYINALCANVGGMYVPMPAALDLTSDDCLRGLGESAKEFAELCAIVSKSLADGSISDNELADIERASGELMASIQSLGVALSARNLAGKPASLRAVG